MQGDECVRVGVFRTIYVYVSAYGICTSVRGCFVGIGVCVCVSVYTVYACMCILALRGSAPYIICLCAHEGGVPSHGEKGERVSGRGWREGKGISRATSVLPNPQAD